MLQRPHRSGLLQACWLQNQGTCFISSNGARSSRRVLSPSPISLTQLHRGARLVDPVLTGAQAVLQLGGGGLWRRGGADGVRQRRGGARRGRPWGPRGRQVSDLAPRLGAAASSSAHRTGQARSSGERSPAGREGRQISAAGLCLSTVVQAEISPPLRWRDINITADTVSRGGILMVC